jgi:hypothetical protein
MKKFEVGSFFTQPDYTKPSKREEFGLLVASPAQVTPSPIPEAYKEKPIKLGSPLRWRQSF